MSNSYSGFAILRKNNDVVWFDAITNISRNYSATVTKHPVSSGGQISDHVVTENPKWSMSAVLSDADFNLIRPTLAELDVTSKNQQGVVKEYTNNTRTVKGVEITDVDGGINKLLPQVIAQFTRDTIPTATVHEQPKIKVAQAVRDELIAMQRNRETFTLLEVDGVKTKGYPGCVLTSLTFTEDETTGEGVFPVMTFEQVERATIQTVQVSIRNRGKQATKTTSKAEATDIRNKPSSYTKDSVTTLER